MLARWPIRYKLVFGVTLVLLIVALLSFSGFRGVYAYRGLVRAVSLRAAELPKATALVRSSGELRYAWKQERSLQSFTADGEFRPEIDQHRFRLLLLNVKTDLMAYKEQLNEGADAVSLWISDKRLERETVEQMSSTLQKIERLTESREWMLRNLPDESVASELDRLYESANVLPNHLYSRMRALRDEVRGKYRTWIILVWSSTILTVALLVLLVAFFSRWVFRPLGIILAGSRRVAAGDFNHRIRLESHDEMGELAGAMNKMTARFQQIRDDLDRQVQIRTRQVVQSEKMASVGFLAAGVAHEINNPLASVAWCAESIESRLDELREESPEFEEWEELATVANYLRTIQTEAFRCKGITEGLLDYSRMGSSERVPTDLAELAQGVIEMVQRLGKYRDRAVRLECQEPVIAKVNAQEMKQVILNLVTNALDSVEPGGTVEVTASRGTHEAKIIVIDDGCGMTEEVRNHLFEPFYTCRRDGQGTGLGLSITYRIIEDHGGTIEAFSDGLGKGSQFTVTLNLDDASSARTKYEQQTKQEAA